MNTLTTDVCILGAGTAGLNARREAERAGRSWLLVEPGPFGTTCARVGCMPSKLLIAAAEAAHEARHAHRFGVHAEGLRVDGREVMDRVKRERDRFAGFVVRDIEALPAHQIVRGRGRLAGPTTVIVDEATRIEATTVVVATGSHPWIPPGLDEVRDRVLVNDDVFELDDLPGSLAVLGTGVIGLELGQAMHRLGVRVRLFNPMVSLAGLEDPVVYTEAVKVFSAELDLHLGARLLRADPHPDGVRLTWREADGTERHDVVDYVLAAAGRRPNSRGLGLETLGVPLGAHGLPAFDPFTMQVADLPVFLAGDVTADRPVLHEAGDEGRIAGANAASWPEIRHGHRRTPLAIAFTEPQIAVVGTRFSDLPADCTAIGQVSFDDQGRSRVMGRNQGVLRVYADTRTHRLLGATVFGPRAEHLAHLLAWAVASELTCNEALERPFYHPVVEEGLRTALRDLAHALKTWSRCPPEDCVESPGA